MANSAEKMTLSMLYWLMMHHTARRALPPQSPSVAGNSASDSVMARPPLSAEHGNVEASEPPEPSRIVESEDPSIPDDSAGDVKRDVGSEFDSDGGWGSDEDITVKTLRNALKSQGMSDASASGIQIHACYPFPVVQDLTAQQARQRPWKLDSIRHLLQNNNWTGTKVEFQMRGKKLAIHSVILTRLDGWSFPLIKSAHLLYVIFTDDGLELAHIESVSCAAADGKKSEESQKDSGKIQQGLSH
jgi:hypothetical protein